MKLKGLIKGCQRGDEKSFKALFDRYVKMISVFFLRNGVPKDLVKSFCTKVFLHVWKQRLLLDVFLMQSEADINKHFINWLHKIASWLISLYYREKNSPKEKLIRASIPISEISVNSRSSKPPLEELLADPVLGIEDILINAEREKLIKGTLKILTENEQDLIRLRVYESVPYQEIVKEFGTNVNEATLRKRFDRALDKLRNFLLTHAIDRYYILLRNENVPSYHEFIQTLVFANVLERELFDILEEELFWLNWFSENKTRLEQMKFCDKRNNKNIWKHFVEKRTYAEIANSEKEAYRVRSTIYSGLKRLSAIKFEEVDFNE